MDRAFDESIRHFTPSRRTVMLGAAGIASLAALGLDTAPAYAAPTRSLAQVLDDARGAVGKKYNQGPWYTYHETISYLWCAHFVSWLLRDGNQPFYKVVSDIREHWKGQGRYRAGGPPKVGALLFYENPGHIGIIERVVNGVGLPIEGNAGDGGYKDNVVKWRDGAHQEGYGPYETPTGYAYPLYDGYDSMTGVGSIGSGDMPELNSSFDDRPRVLTPGEWTWIYINTDNDMAFIKNGAVADAQLTYQVSGLGEGAVVEARFVKVTVSGSTATITKEYPSSDLVGNGSTVKGQYSQKIGLSNGDSYRARVQVRTAETGVTLDWAELRWLEW